jgi:hypothetical protein
MEWRWLCNPSITNLRPPRTSPCVPARAPADRVHTDHRPEPNAPLRLWARAGNAAPGGWVATMSRFLASYCDAHARRGVRATRHRRMPRRGPDVELGCQSMRQLGGFRPDSGTRTLAVPACVLAVLAALCGNLLVAGGHLTRVTTFLRIPPLTVRPGHLRNSHLSWCRVYVCLGVEKQAPAESLVTQKAPRS